MVSGNHCHVCPKCHAEKMCPRVTHCRLPVEILCPICDPPSLIKDRAEEYFAETGKWPGEK